MIAFWVVAGVLSALAAGLILFRAAKAAAAPEAADPTPILYRRQLSEIDDLAERGLIGETEKKSAYAEAGRRLLSAAERPGEGWSSGPAARPALMAAVVAAPALALGLYLWLGAPGFPDQPFAKRLETWKGWVATDPGRLGPAEGAALMERVAKERPKDAEAQRVLAMMHLAAQNPGQAVRALERAVELAPERADLWSTLGEALVFRDGDVTPAAEAAFQESLRRDPAGISARFHLARARIARGDKVGGVAEWRALLASLPADDERRPVLIQAIAEAEAQPQTPSVAGSQMAAIRGMVEGLAQRLQTDPDNPDGWVRLVRAYAVLGETGKRDEALKTARARYASRPDILEQLATAAAAEPMR
ncbi:c-type cytochrome biogenesis protein CcmI [Phenylobacterium sp.]|jgi:cytochrome c-type biogenesis protein CcmH|uniref:c-type cytochrome biogenesis protein CcmI n=1 Tax=Phenylobacterium sp. TaxID=1871053 RepID=UPI002F92B436